MFPPKRRSYKRYINNNGQQLANSNYQKLMKDGIEIFPNSLSKNMPIKINPIDKKENLQKNNIDNDSHIIYEIFNQQINQDTKRVRVYNTKIKNDISFQKELNNSNNDSQYKNDLNKENNDNDIDLNDILQRKKFSFFTYVKYLICCKKNNPKISYYEDFRNKIISEENLLQNYIDIYQLLKIYKDDKEPSSIVKRNLI